MKIKLVVLFTIAFMTTCTGITGITGEETFRTLEIEGCEYLEKYNGYNRGYSFTHKGNCKNPIHFKSFIK